MAGALGDPFTFIGFMAQSHSDTDEPMLAQATNDSSPSSDLQIDKVGTGSRHAKGGLLTDWTIEALSWLLSLGLVIAIAVILNAYDQKPLAIGPFVQQIIDTVPAPRALGNATLPICANIPRMMSQTHQTTYTATSDAFRDDPELGVSIGAALFPGFFAAPNTSFDVAPSLRGANSTWAAPFWTLGVESQCQNVTHRLQWTQGKNMPHSDPNYEGPYPQQFWTLPNGHYTTNWISPGPVPEYFTFNVSSESPTVAFDGLGHVIVDYSIIAASWPDISNQSGNSSWAWECVLQLVAWQLNASYTNGILTETKLSPAVFNNSAEAVRFSPWMIYSGQTVVPQNENGGGTDFSHSIDPEVASMSIADPARGFALDINLSDMLEVTFAAMTLFRGAYRSHDTVSERFYELSQAWTAGTYKNNLGDITANVARSLTQGLRSTIFNNQSAVNLAQGEAFQTEVVYQVSWGWISLPTVLVFLTLVLLIWTIAGTRTRGLEKRASNSIATIAYGADEVARTHIPSALTNSELKKIARNVSVKLDENTGALAYKGMKDVVGSGEEKA
ncbi:MAG: hypothetical protein Q9162_006272 [Coniocarpon cinnabarinum]